MKYKNVMLVSEDLQKVKDFYKEVLGLRVICDFGENITLTGGISFQTKTSWSKFAQIPMDSFHFGGFDKELYFEEDEFDAFVQKISSMEEVKLLHGVETMPWGQRGVHFLDPDQHMIEVSETLACVAKRFQAQGMDDQAIAKRMDIPLSMVKRFLK